MSTAKIANNAVTSAQITSNAVNTINIANSAITAGKLSDEKKAEINASIPLARLGAASDVAGACVFLASELSAYCTGITLDVNGGMLIH